jgi:hypothetical protein
MDVEAAAVAEVWQATGRAPLLLSPRGGGGLLSRRLLADEDLPPAQTLMRPFRVADLIERVKSMLG